MNVSLTPELERWVREKVDSGLYGSASEVVREALRLLALQEQTRADGRHRRQPGAEGQEEGGPAADRRAAARLREALALLDLTHSLLEQNLRRERPDASESEIAERLAAHKAEADWADEAPGYLERSPERLAKLLRVDA